MGWVFRRPMLTAWEVAWRWLFGIPALLVCWFEARRILTALPLDSTGLADFNIANPWLAAVQVADAWVQYRPHVLALLPTVVAPAALAWVVISGIGRNVVLKRIDTKLPFRPAAQILLQAAWLVTAIVLLWAWFRSIGWDAAAHIGSGAQPDLVGYFIWAIFLSLGFFTLWAAVSWIVSIAPLLVLLENRSAFGALVQSFKLGKSFIGKLIEINLVMGIVKLCLLVLAMVFSAVFLPFSQEVGSGTLHVDWIIVSIAYCIASDYFQVVRLKAFLEFWQIYRHGTASEC
jgi:hypothetical protein